MKVNQNRHDLTDAQTSFSLPLYFATGELLRLPYRHKNLTEIIDMAK
jgi:hypothetical protein